MPITSVIRMNVNGMNNGTMYYTQYIHYFLQI